MSLWKKLKASNQKICANIKIYLYYISNVSAVYAILDWVLLVWKLAQKVEN